MRMIDRFNRQDNEDIIIIGEALESFLKGDLGQVFPVMIENLKKMEISNSRANNIPAERALGRIEAYDTVINDFLSFIERKQELQKPIPNAEPERGTAEEQTTPIRGGEI